MCSIFYILYAVFVIFPPSLDATVPILLADYRREDRPAGVQDELNMALDGQILRILTDPPQFRVSRNPTCI